jgi:hypothetical protein
MGSGHVVVAQPGPSLSLPLSHGKGSRQGAVVQLGPIHVQNTSDGRRRQSVSNVGQAHKPLSLRERGQHCLQGLAHGPAIRGKFFADLLYRMLVCGCSGEARHKVSILLPEDRCRQPFQPSCSQGENRLDLNPHIFPKHGPSQPPSMHVIRMARSIVRVPHVQIGLQVQGARCNVVLCRITNISMSAGMFVLFKACLLQSHTLIDTPCYPNWTEMYIQDEPLSAKHILSKWHRVSKPWVAERTSLSPDMFVLRKIGEGTYIQQAVSIRTSFGYSSRFICLAHSQ